MADRWDFQFESFVSELQLSQLIKGDAALRRAFAAKYARELAFVSLYLNDLKVIGGSNEEHDDPPGRCDFCSEPFAELGFFVDGETKDSSWASMCPNCYADNGIGIGWGIGQLYRNLTDGRWQCVAGGNPALPDSD